jgi:hypothetical protein
LVLPLTCLYNYFHLFNYYLISIPSIFSLELDAPTIVPSPMPASKESVDKHVTCLDNQVQSEECRSNACGNSCDEPEVLEESPQGIAAEKFECVDLNKGNGDLSYPCSEDRVAISEEGSPQKIVQLDHSTMDKLLHKSSDANQLVGKILNKQNGMKSGPCRLENTESHVLVDDNSRSSRHSNGFAFTESVGLPENGLGSSGELGSMEVCNQVNGLSSTRTGVTCSEGKPDGAEHTVDNSFSSSDASISGKGIVCLYQCCPECLHNLHGLMKKILIRVWGLNRSHWTAEDVHDVVASLSVDILSAVKKVYVSENFSGSFDGKLKDRKYVEHPEMRTCHCENSGNSVVMQTECSCHSIGQSLTAKANTSENIQLRLDSKFLFRDGVLVHVDPGKEVSYHCKFETLCLCSLIELIVMTKQPFD